MILRKSPLFLAKLAEGYDMVSGWRAQRRDGWLTRRLPSRIANWMMAKLSGVPLHDFGTTFKAYRREVIQSIPLYGDLHRFIPALATWSGARIAEIPIKNTVRRNGKSNYGILRTFHVVLDLISTKFLARLLHQAAALFRIFRLNGNWDRQFDRIGAGLQEARSCTRKSCSRTGRSCLP